MMNEELQDFARAQIKNGLAKCSDEQQLLFRRMYSHTNLDASIDEAVDAMDAEKLDWAMQQISRTLESQ